MQRINRIVASGETLPLDARSGQPDSMILQSHMPLRRGSWHFYPQDNADDEAPVTA
ncbi:MAG TPA: hypothetical protein VJZ25_00785 [Gemmatimonadaceae bacterium]|nr:hypothetical protein [Gemmatimonadaceae bacterium]